MTNKPNRNPERLFSVIRDVLAEYPDLRVGQIISSALPWASFDSTVFYIENDSLAEDIEAWFRKVTAKQST